MSESSPVVNVAAAVYRGVERLPVIGGLLHQTRTELAAVGERAVTAIAVQIVERVLDELDLTELVRQRVDLVGLANEVVDRIDLQAIIRQSTESVGAEVMSDVRSQGERADDLVAGFVDRLLGRGPDG